MLEKFHLIWDQIHKLIILCIAITLIIHFIKQRQKYRNVPREISSQLWFDVHMMYASVKVMIEDQVLSIEKARSMIRKLESIKENKKRLDRFLKFPTELDQFYLSLDEYIAFLTDFIEKHQSRVEREEIEITLLIQDKNSIHYQFKEELKILENELWPVSTST